MTGFVVACVAMGAASPVLALVAVAVARDEVRRDR